MRSTAANKAYIVFIFSLAACSYRPEKTLIEGNWKNLSILRNDTMAVEISDNDFLHLDKDSSFYYSLEYAKKYMKGTWDYSDHTLHLHYKKPDTTRHFEIDILTMKNLQFHEGNTVFRYTRID